MTEQVNREIATTCPYCGVGCGVLVQPSEDGESAIVRGDPDHPSNFGRLCVKGSALGETLGLEDRILYPEIKGQRASWEDAMDEVARGFRDAIRQHGPDSVAFYVSGQILTEDYYVANKLMKGFIGSSNIDTNSRLCMASSVAGHKRAFGTDTVPGCYEDLEEADLIVMVGSNLAWCHPVLYQRIQSAREKRGTKLVIIDPRQTATTDGADLHLAITPGADVALFNALFHYLSESAARDERFIEAHTNGYADAISVAGEFNLPQTAKLTGLFESDLRRFFELFAATERTVTIYSQGVNQSSAGSDKVNSIINCHLVTGRIGKAGMGPFSVTGQPNAMGGREVGGLANQLACHMDFAPEDIIRVERFWKAPRIASGPGLKAVEMFDAVLSGQIKAIWIMATNPVVSLPNADKVKAALAACPLVVVSDVATTSDTVALADVVLPATTWGEKTGTVTNSERRISRQRSFLKPPGETRHDWWALCDLGKRLDYDGFDFNGPAAIFREYAALSAYENDGLRDFDIGAYANTSDPEYDALKPFQWPAPAGDTPRHGEDNTGSDHRFFQDGHFYTKDHKARFVATAFTVPASLPSDDLPFILNTGRVRDHWHTMTRTGKSSTLSGHIAEPYLEIHPKDADQLGLSTASLARISNTYGEAVLRVLITDRMQRKSVFVPMHWSAANSSAARVDALIAPNTDPISGQPESKHGTITVKPVSPAWYGFLVSRLPLNDEILNALDYWAVATSTEGYRYEIAGSEVANRIIDKITADTAITFKTHDGQHAAAMFDADRLELFITLSESGPVVADRAWISSLLAKTITPEIRLGILAGRPPSGEGTGRLVCSCNGVGINQIEDAISKGAQSVEGIGAATGAGTTCGSCKPELRALLRAAAAKASSSTPASIAAE